MTQPCGRSDRSFPPRPSATVHGVRSGRLRYSIAITARATTRTQACSRPRCFGRCFATCAPTWTYSFIRYLQLFAAASHQFASPPHAARLNDPRNCAFLGVEGGSPSRNPFRRFAHFSSRRTNDMKRRENLRLLAGAALLAAGGMVRTPAFAQAQDADGPFK